MTTNVIQRVWSTICGGEESNSSIHMIFFLATITFFFRRPYKEETEEASYMQTHSILSAVKAWLLCIHQIQSMACSRNGTSAFALPLISNVSDMANWHQSEKHMASKIFVSSPQPYARPLRKLQCANQLEEELKNGK